VLKFGVHFRVTIPTSLFAELNAFDSSVNTDNYFLYFSPEQLLGEKLTEKSDVWSLGCILYHLLFGRPPWSLDLPNNIFKGMK